MKENRWMIILTSIITLLPVLAGNTIPVFIFIVHMICVFATIWDKNNKGQSRKVMRMIFWICPFLSLYVTGLNYAVKSGLEFGVDILTFLMIGVLFVAIGNYLPKCKQNYTIGIKVPWVYTSEENWNRTHRLGGKLWVIGGLLLLLSIFIPGEGVKEVVIVTVILAMVVIPVVYSYLFYRKEREEGKAVSPSVLLGRNGKVSAVFVVGIFIFVGIMMFTGNIEFQCGKDALVIEADYWEDMTVSYDRIESVEYREEGVSGSRTAGFGSARLLMGTFDNDEFDYYTRYSYTRCDSAIVLILETNQLVISDKDEESTKALYEELTGKLNR